MNLPIYQVDAFCGEPFSGNPAAICPLDKWLDDVTMQNIAMENNLAETAFFVKNGNEYDLRWFTPAVEVDLCGHATLASAHVLYTYLNYASDKIIFNTRSGKLVVEKKGEHYIMNFPADELHKTETLKDILKDIDTSNCTTYKGKTDYIVFLESEEQVRNLKPDLRVIAELDARGVIATAKGDNADFVCRFFGPQSGIDEDPATGSAQTSLVPLWVEILNKKALSSIQLSKRKGYFESELDGDRVNISGRANTFLIGEIQF